MFFIKQKGPCPLGCLCSCKLIQFSLSQAPSTAQYVGFLHLQNMSFFQTVTLVEEHLDIQNPKKKIMNFIGSVDAASVS